MVIMKPVVFACALLLAGCADNDGIGAADDRFISTMVDLRQAAFRAGMDTARFEQLRDSVLSVHGVTEADLRAYVERHSGDLEHMAAVWDSVSARLSELPGAEPQ